MAFYFEKFEHRKPPEPVPHRPYIELVWQFLAVIALVLGGNYIYWRWTASLNYDALWFAIPLAFAETCAYFGLFLFAFNLWKVKDYPQQEPPKTISDCLAHALDDHEDRPVSVDLFIATYSEEEELVRLSIKDAKNVNYPHYIDYKIFVLDDGRRASMKAVCDEEGVGYITRSNNIGFKAGNLRNAMEKTHGDFIVICDADTRVFPTILEDTLGYFRDPKVAWVQTNTLSALAKNWRTARVRPLRTAVQIDTAFVTGLPCGRFPETDLHPGIDESPFGGYEIHTQWSQGLIYPPALHRM